MSVIVQPCPASWLSLKPLWLSKWPILFLVAPTSWRLSETSVFQSEELRQHWDSGRLEARPSGSGFENMQIYTVLRDPPKHKPRGQQSPVIQRCPLAGSCKTRAPDERMSLHLGGSNEPQPGVGRAGGRRPGRKIRKKKMAPGPLHPGECAGLQMFLSR